MRKNTPICITGGSGFIGTHLIRQLIQEGRRSITVVDHKAPSKEFGSSIRFFKGEFYDPRILSKAITPHCIVVHLAGTSNQATAEKNPIHDAEISIVGTLKLLDECVRKKVSKIVFLSSAPAVYGGAKKLPVEVDTVAHPRSAYGVMKLAVEHYVRQYAERNNFSYVILRSANAYGPGQFAVTHGVVSKFIYNTLHRLPIEIWGSPHVMRDFVFVEDVTRAIAASLDSHCVNVTLHVASGKGTTLGALIRIIEQVSGIKAQVVVKEQRFIDVPDLYFSIRTTTKVLGWRPSVALAEGVAKTLQWIKDMSPSSTEP